jgi:hypothetical protein
MLYGPVTSKQNTKNGYFLTDLIQGDEVTLYLYEPDLKKGRSKIIIRKVVHAYRNLFSESYGNLGGASSCNKDIACYPAWDEESDAVALVLLSGGTELCSGSLLMTADQTFEPYFLSAFHCVDLNKNRSLSASEISYAESWMFKFQYKMTSCGGSTATTGVTYNGAEFRAAWSTSDFALMEMDVSPVGDTRFSWLGWDRSGSSPTEATCIHHPAGDVMKYSFDSDSPTLEEYDTHWFVDNWDIGTTEGGSSGSPLFDQNKRVIGQDHKGDGYAPCHSEKGTYFGCFYRSWTGGGTDSTRLSTCLNPCSSGATTINTSRSPYISGSTLVCFSGTSFTVNNLPAGATIFWNMSSNLTRVSAQGSNPCTFRALGSGLGWVEATLSNGCGSIALPQKEVWAGRPLQPYDIWFIPSTPCLDQTVIAQARVYNTALSATTYEWRNISNFTYHSSDYKEVHFITSSGPLPYGTYVYVKGTNSCGSSSEYSEYLWVDDCGGGVPAAASVVFTPNPTSGETVLSIKSGSEEETLDETIEWDLEIYSETLVLKEKKNQLVRFCKPRLSNPGFTILKTY